MIFFKQLFWKHFFAVLMCVLFSFGDCSLPALAQTGSTSTAVTQVSQNSLVETSRFIYAQNLPLGLSIFRWFRRRKNSEGAPTNTRSAGRRGSCNTLNQSFVALVPHAELPEPLENTAVGITTQVQPTILVYIPDLSDVAQLSKSGSIEFMVQQLQETGEIDLPNNSVPISLSLPNSEGLAEVNFKDLGLTLEPNQGYHWYLSIVCNSKRPSRNPSIDAWIEVLDTDNQNEIEKQAETLSLLTYLRCQEPKNEEYLKTLKILLSEIFLDSQIDTELGATIVEAVESQSCPIRLQRDNTQQLL